MTPELTDFVTAQKNEIDRQIDALFSAYPNLKNNSYPDDLFLIMDKYLSWYADGLAMDNAHDRKKLISVIKKFLRHDV